MKYNISKFNTKRNLSLLKIFTLFFLAAANCFSQNSQINSFPYSENFNNGEGGWTLYTVSTTPSGLSYWSVEGSVQRGTGAWHFDSGSPEMTRSNDYVESPEFDFTGVSKVRFSFEISFVLNSNNYIKLQYKIGNGGWQDFTASIDSQNWYSGSGWSGSKKGKETASSTSTAFANQQHVKFRFIANTSNLGERDGFSFTNIKILNYSNTLDSDSDGIPNKIESTNLAALKPVRMRSTYGSYVGKNATDGIINAPATADALSNMAHTGGENLRDWIEVDLGDIYHIDRIKIWNRTDGYRNRLGNVYVIVSEDPFSDDLIPENIEFPFIINFPTDSPNENPGDPEIQVNTRGRYVRLQKSANNPGGNWLNIAEIEVWQDPDTDNDGTPNYLDYDSDGDGLNDTLERGTNTITTVDDLPDTNGNGVPDYLDTGTLTWSLVNNGRGGQSRRLVMKNIYTGPIRITAFPLSSRGVVTRNLGSFTKDSDVFTHDFEYNLVPESPTYGYSIRVEMVDVGVTWRVKTL